MIQININDRNQSNLPIRLKKVMNYAFLDFLSRPIRRILASFYDFHTKNRELSSINGQIIYLEYILNRYFNPTVFDPDFLSPSNFNPNNNLIYIRDITEVENEVILFNNIENNEEPFVFNTSESATELYLNNIQETLLWADFIIAIPLLIQYDVNYLESVVKQFKLASKRYKIIEV